MLIECYFLICLYGSINKVGNLQLYIVDWNPNSSDSTALIMAKYEPRVFQVECKHF